MTSQRAWSRSSHVPTSDVAFRSMWSRHSAHGHGTVPMVTSQCTTGSRPDKHGHVALPVVTSQQCTWCASPTCTRLSSQLCACQRMPHPLVLSQARHSPNRLAVVSFFSVGVLSHSSFVWQLSNQTAVKEYLRLEEEYGPGANITLTFVFEHFLRSKPQIQMQQQAHLQSKWSQNLSGRAALSSALASLIPLWYFGCAWNIVGLQNKDSNARLPRMRRCLPIT